MTTPADAAIHIVERLLTELEKSGLVKSYEDRVSKVGFEKANAEVHEILAQAGRAVAALGDEFGRGLKALVFGKSPDRFAELDREFGSIVGGR